MRAAHSQKPLRNPLLWQPPCELRSDETGIARTLSTARLGHPSRDRLGRSPRIDPDEGCSARFVYFDHYRRIILTSYSTTTPTPSLPAGLLAPPSRRRREQTQVASRPARVTRAGSRLTVTMRSRSPLMHWRMVCRRALSALAHKHVQRRSRRPTRRISRTMPLIWSSTFQNPTTSAQATLPSESRILGEAVK